MKEITVSDIEENLDTIMDEIGDGECFTITDHEGQPIAVLVPYEDYCNSMDVAGDLGSI